MAQRVSSAIDIGAASMLYADSINASGLAISPMVRADWTRALVRGTGTYAQLGAGRWSTQGLLTTSVFTPGAKHFSGELLLSTGGSAHWDGTRTGQSVAAVRGHFDRQNAGVWAGGGGGLMWDGFQWHPDAVSELGGWARVGKSTLIATAAPTIAND